MRWRQSKRRVSLLVANAAPVAQDKQGDRQGFFLGYQESAEREPLSRAYGCGGSKKIQREKGTHPAHAPFAACLRVHWWHDGDVFSLVPFVFFSHPPPTQACRRWPQAPNRRGWQTKIVFEKKEPTMRGGGCARRRTLPTRQRYMERYLGRQETRPISHPPTSAEQRKRYEHGHFFREAFFALVVSGNLAAVRVLFRCGLFFSTFWGCGREPIRHWPVDASGGPPNTARQGQEKKVARAQRKKADTTACAFSMAPAPKRDHRHWKGGRAAHIAGERGRETDEPTHWARQERNRQAQGGDRF
nr:hypothetical protein [Pandoravirus massiliensis]